MRFPCLRVFPRDRRAFNGIEYLCKTAQHNHLYNSGKIRTMCAIVSGFKCERAFIPFTMAICSQPNHTRLLCGHKSLELLRIYGNCVDICIAHKTNIVWAMFYYDCDGNRTMRHNANTVSQSATLRTEITIPNWTTTNNITTDAHASDSRSSTSG